MKHRGEKFYFEIGIFRDWARLEYNQFIFRLFFLKQRPPEGELLRFGRDYLGINYVSKGWKLKNPH